MASTTDPSPQCIASTFTYFNDPSSSAAANLLPQTFRPKPSNFFKQLQLSADGTTVVTHSQDESLRTFVLPPELLEKRLQPHALAPYSTLLAPTNVRSWGLYPGYNLSNPDTTLILSAATDQPIRLTNALDSNTTHTQYTWVNDKTEAFIAPHSMLFHPDGRHFVAGSYGTVAIFDVEASAKGPISTHLTKPKDPRRAASSMRDGTHMMALDLSYDGILAVGSSNRNVGLFSQGGHGRCDTSFPVAPKFGDPDAAKYKGTGITSVKWTPDGNYLLIGERQSDGIHVYDVRNQLRRLAWLSGRNAHSPQRMDFSITHKHLTGSEAWAGGVDGAVRMWERPGEKEGDQEPDYEVKDLHRDAVTSVVWHFDGSIMATCSGQKFPDKHESDSDSDSDSDSESEGESGSDDESEKGTEDKAKEEEKNSGPDNSLKIWTM